VLPVSSRETEPTPGVWGADGNTAVLHDLEERVWLALLVMLSGLP